MSLARRKFIVAGGIILAGAAGGAAWLNSSSSRLARFARQLARDVPRSPAAPQFKPTPKAWPENAISACWIGHASVLIGFYGVNVLIDPVFSTRVGIGFGLGTIGPKRYVAPALTPHELPRIDLLLISHAHMDHLDIPSLRRLPPSTLTVTARETADLCASAGLKSVTEIGWGETVRHKTARGEIVIEAFEVKHWGRRWPSNRDRGYNGYILRREDRALLFAGDTGYTAAFAGLKSRGPFDLALMPIGAYNPWIRNHCTPEEAVRMADLAEAKRIAPIHHKTFKLSEEPMDEPLERFEQALRGEHDRIAFRRIGESCCISL
ncbi:MAG: MBL fold metallo-hydrolase [Verrucomicrobiia bacterium]